MTVWDEVKRLYVIKRELNRLPSVQVRKGQKQHRWCLQGEVLSLEISIDREIQMSNWLVGRLLEIAVWAGESRTLVEILGRKLNEK